MKIGIVTTWFERGAAYVSKEFESIFIAQGHEVFIFARGGESYARRNKNWNNDNVFWSYPGIFNFNGTPIKKFQFKYWLKKNKIDTVIFNEQQSWMPVIWAKESGCKIGSYIDYYKEDNLELFNLYDFLICNTKRHRSAFKNHHNVIYIPWGTNIDLYTNNNSNNFIKKKTGIKKDYSKKNFFCSAGMNPDRKGIDILINTLFKIDRSNMKFYIHSQKNILKVFPSLKDKIEILKNEGCKL